MDRVERVLDNSGIGRIEEAFDAENVAEWAEGNLSGFIYRQSIGLLLLNALGVVNTTDNADSDASIKDHTFTVGNTTSHPSLTLTHNDGNEDLAYALSMLTSLEITAELNQFVRYNASFLAKASASADTDPSYSADSRFRAQDVTVKMADTVAELSGASAIKLRSAGITITKNTEREHALGAIGVDDIFNRQFSVGVSLNALYRDNTWVELVRNGTKKALSIAFVNSAVTIGTSANPSLTFTFDPGHFNPRELEGGLDDLKTETVEFMGLFSLANSSMMQAVLVNDVATY